MDIMIDIETLALTPNATILSIGAIEFTATGLGQEFYIELDPKQDRSIDPETALWWAQQSSAFLDKRKSKIGVAVGKLLDFMVPKHLDNYGRLVTTTEKTGRVWANSPVFDLAILRNAFEQVGAECPWAYHQERDVRTAKAFVEKQERPAFVGQRHNALDDARHQARLVQAFLSRAAFTL